MNRYLCVLLLTAACSLIGSGQPFSSGSTGADGALDLTLGDQVIQLPDSGILNYTTVNVPAGRTLTFANNLRNTPVVILAQGDVTIAGRISVSASGITPGPGGFYGGAPGQPGFGPGAGQPAFSNNPIQHNGTWIGPLSLVPNIGGSGGGGSSGCAASVSGGSGGGAITIASSTSINITSAGSIVADSSNGGGIGCFGQFYYIGSIPGSSGGPGAIRLVANSLNVGGYFSAAVVRLEAPLSALTYSGTGTPPVRSTVNSAIIPANAPILNIISIGGYPVPSYSGSSFSTIDLLLPTQLQDPIPVVVQATNVPVGSPVSIAFSGSSGATSTTATLTGTNASSTATVYVSGLNRGGGAVTYLFASTTFSASLIAGNIKTNDPSGLSDVRLAVAPGGKTTYRFLRKDGSEIEPVKLSAAIRSYFGL